jgi:hypothetical protein
MLPFCQRLTLRLERPDALDHALDRVGRVERLLQLPGDAEALHRQRLSEAFAQRRGGTRVGVLELAGEAIQMLTGGGVVGGRPRVAQARLDAVAIAVGQQVEYVAPLGRVQRCTGVWVRGRR